MSKRKFTDSFGSKGYYIALILCAAVIGISGYLYYANSQKAPASEQTQPVQSVQEPETVPAAILEPEQLQPTMPGHVTEPQTPQKQPLKTGLPVEGQTIADYAMDCLVYNQTTRDWRVHNGIDIAAEEGTPVCAAAAGTVESVYEDETMGMTVVIRHADGYTTKYACLAPEVSVAAGDTVKLGQTIGYVGTTALMESALGYHVHFCVSCNGKSVSPQDFFALGT